MNERLVNLPVVDPFGVTADQEMPSLASALDPDEAQRQFEQQLGHLAKEGDTLSLRRIRATRYKPGRRCVIEYDLDVQRPGAEPEALTLIGKVRRLRSGKSGFRLLDALWNAGFGDDSRDGISVPEPIGVVPEFRMWLQRKVPGRTATDLLAGPDGEWLVRRIAEAAHKLHRSNVPAKRRHTMDDELCILHERLLAVARARPRWAERIGRLLGACDRLGAATPEPAYRGTHRDFYADQVIVDGERLYLIDFDLYCEGDQGLDIGNFLGHVTEQALRTFGDSTALVDLERAMEERFIELSGEAPRAAVRAYATLTLVRHIHLSTLFEERRPFTESLLELCEERLDARGKMV